MVPAHSIKVSRVSMYSGYRHVIFPFAYGAFTLSGRLSQNLSARINESIMRSEPHGARTMVWPLSISLAATLEIDFFFLFLRLLRCFSSPGSLPYHVFLRLLVPRHPPCALSCLTSYLAVFHSVEIQGLAFLKRVW